MQTTPWPWTGWLLVLSSQLAAQPAALMELPSCVVESPPMRVPASTAMAALDRADSHRFLAAALERYPLYERGGPVPRGVLLLQRDGEWLYVTTAPSGTAGTCFTAVFAANRFDFTGRWLQKYRPAARAGTAD